MTSLSGHQHHHSPDSAGTGVDLPVAARLRSPPMAPRRSLMSGKRRGSSSGGYSVAEAGGAVSAAAAGGGEPLRVHDRL